MPKLYRNMQKVCAVEGLPGASYVARFIDEPRSKRPPASRAEPRDLRFVSQVVR